MKKELLGKKIGSGERRDVFNHREDDSLVIKRLKSGGDNHNKIEMENWNNADKETRKFLAPCIAISDDGYYLVQKKGISLEKCNRKKKTHDDAFEIFLKKMKYFRTTDRKKPSNWVYIDEELKMCDYGYDNFNKMLTVVIPTFNRKEVLKGLLDCLKKQTDKDFETIVVMDGCNDGTEEMLKSYKGLELKWFDTGNKPEVFGTAKARNLGNKMASGEIVLNIDDDSYPDEKLVEEHKKTAKRGVLTSGARIPDTEDDVDNLNGKMEYLLKFYGSRNPQPLKCFVVMNNCCMYKVNWLDVPFNESLERYGVIEVDCLNRLIEKNYMFQFNPEAKITHMSKHKRKYI